MHAELLYSECDLLGCGDWSDPETVSKFNPEHLAGVSWQNRTDDGFGVLKGILVGVCLSLPLWGAIIGGSMFLFRT